MSRKNQKRKARQTGEAGQSTSLRENGSYYASDEDAEPRFASWHEQDRGDSEGGNEPLTWRSFIAHYPVTTLVATFGVGVGLGVLGVAALAAGRRETNPWGRPLRHLSEAVGELPGKIAERMPNLSPWG